MLNSDPVNGGVMQAFVHTVEHGVTALPLVPDWPSNAALGISDRDANGEIVIVGGGVYGRTSTSPSGSRRSGATRR